MLVHLDAADLLESYVLFEVKIDEALIEGPGRGGSTARLAIKILRRRGCVRWGIFGPPPARRWRCGVPSSLIPEEYNYLLNPNIGVWQMEFWPCDSVRATMPGWRERK